MKGFHLLAVIVCPIIAYACFMDGGYFIGCLNIAAGLVNAIALVD